MELRGRTDPTDQPTGQKNVDESAVNVLCSREMVPTRSTDEQIEQIVQPSSSLGRCGAFFDEC